MSLLSIASKVAASAVVIISLCMATACQSAHVESSGKQQLSASRKMYTDAESVAKDSSLIVQGRLDRVMARSVDDGGSPGAELGIPTILFEIGEYKVGGASKRDSAKIVLTWVDTDKVESADLIPLEVGQEYVFFLEKVDKQDRGGLQEYETLYAPVSGIAGVFKVASETSAIASDPALVRLEKDGPMARRTSGRLAADPRDLLKLVPGKQ